MSPVVVVAALFFVANANAAPSPPPPTVVHDARVTVDVGGGSVSVVDKIAGAPKSFVVELRPDDTHTIAGGKVTDTKTVGSAQQLTIEREGDVVTITTKARIVAPPVQAAAESQRSFQETTGTIDAQGVYLSPQSRWLPVVLGDDGAPALVSGSISVDGLPTGWSALCEGTRDGSTKAGAKTTTWTETKALDGFHLIAGPFSIVKENKRGVSVEIWLRQKDNGRDGKDADDAAALADRYLEVTGQYLEQYETLIGKYPYGKFALVENFWETGYGMPSFTLLGSQVVRFPFILHTSWPHELLHNWWGNGVFVHGGNWSEGLTAYLADQLNAEQGGKGAEYRRTQIQRFLDFVDVDDKNDFALVDFGSRDSAASEAVGYGKTSMMFHMLRRQIGDEAFKKGLQTLWKNKAQQRASFDDVAASFTAASGTDVSAFFAAWTTQKGIPTIALREVREEKKKNGERTVTVVLEQSVGSAGGLFPLEVPVVLTTVEGKSVSTRVVLDPKKGPRGSATIQIPKALARVDVDPFFDVFRRLLPQEIPPSLSRGLGANKMLFITPTFASAEEKAAWQVFAKGICPEASTKGSRCTIVDDKQVQTLPNDAAVWVLGYGSYLRAAPFVFTRPWGVRFDDHGFFPPGAWERVVAAKDRLAALKTERVDTAVTGLAVVVEHPRNPALALTFVASPSTKMIPLLARKIPHYGKYGYVGFEGSDATNNLKGTWSQSTSPLTFFMQNVDKQELKTKETAALATLPPPFDGEALKAVAAEFAAPALEGRGKGSAGLDKARALVMEKLKKSGIQDIETICDTADKTVCNVVAHLKGSDPALARVVLGAHLDHLGKEKMKVFAGADDNASGVAVALEVARQVNKQGGARALDVVFFDGEEAGRLGSISYVAKVGVPAIHSMVNLDTVGRLADGKPLLVLDGDSASEWVHVARGVGFTTNIDVQLAPQGGGASDQKSFNDAGIAAIQLFSGPNADYHQPTDTADKLSPASLVKAAVVAREIVAYLRDRKEPMTTKALSALAPNSATRKASLGSVPDMAFAGPGVRFDDVVAGSAAEKAGLKKGDVLVKFDGRAVADLRGYSELLKTKNPGDKVAVVVVRDGKDVSVVVELGAR